MGKKGTKKGKRDSRFSWQLSRWLPKRSDLDDVIAQLGDKPYKVESKKRKYGSYYAVFVPSPNYKYPMMAYREGRKYEAKDW